MSRTVITAVVSIVIGALTAVAYFITSTSFDDKVRKDAEAQLRRAYGVVQQLAQLESIDIANKAERLAADRAFVGALKTEAPADRAAMSRVAFANFTSNEKEGDVKPDLVALVDAQGNLVAMHDVANVVPKQWQNPSKPTETIIPALNVVLGSRVIISDIWNDKGRMMKIGVAPVIDPEAPVAPTDQDGVVIIGAVVVAYAQTANQARQDKRLLGTDIAYYDSNKVVSTSFTKTANDEDASKASELSALLGGAGIAQGGNRQKITLGGHAYYAAVVALPRSTTNAKRLPADYPKVTAGAVLLAPASDAAGTGNTINLFILLLGAGALAISLFGMHLAHRRLVAQVDQIEIGVTDIINGNLDRTLRPVGPELDGLANGLNVMLSRLLGRPEPGEEELDNEGNPIMPGRVEFEEGEGRPAVDPDLASLAQESEPDYYKRMFTEYVAARTAVGAPDPVSFENFIAKLKVNEGKLKAQFSCRAVRFRVLTKDGKVTLMPVPIFE
jgi:hypothetical protein